jgi:predicted O-methyltransferase YrrM
MFHDIPALILERMAALQAIDARDRQDGTPVSRRLRQIVPETGRFLSLLAVSAPKGQVLEVGTSGGYSALWLALACRQRDDMLTTFELSPEKVHFAQDTFAAAGVQDIVQVIQGDARQFLPQFQEVAFCFMDAEKELYQEVYSLVVPNLVIGGWFVADNAISHRQALGDFLSYVDWDSRVDSLVIPIGKGVLACRKG